MSPIPLPSHIHYELLLQLLERQTLPALDLHSPHYDQVQAIIIYLRKALVQQKQLEVHCQRSGRGVEYRWSLNDDMTGVQAADGTPERA